MTAEAAATRMPQPPSPPPRQSNGGSARRGPPPGTRAQPRCSAATAVRRRRRPLPGGAAAAEPPPLLSRPPLHNGGPLPRLPLCLGGSPPRRGGTCRGLWVTATGMAAAATEGRPPAVWPPTPWRVWLPSWPPVAGTGVRTGPPAPPLPGVARCVGAQSVAAGRRRRAARRPAISTDGRAGPARRAGARAVHLLTAHPVFVGVGKGGDGTDPRLGWEEEGEAILAMGRDMSRLRRGRHEQQLGLE